MTDEPPRSIYETLVTQHLPAEWTARPLSGAAQIVVGSTPSREVAAFWGGEIPWITPTEITQAQGRLIVGTREGITGEGLASCTASLLPVGSVLVTTRATIGACAVAGVPMATNQGVAGLVCKDSVCEWFVHYGVAAAARLLGRIAAGTTFDEISRSDLGRVLLPFPPLPEQRAIAEALRSADEVIERSRAFIEQLGRVKKALMQELLTQGLPGRHTRFKPTPVGEIPEEWEVVRLADLVEPSRPICYGILMPGEDVPGGVPVAKVKDYLHHELCLDELLRTAPSIDAQYPRSRLRAGDILLAIRGTTGRVVVTPPELDGANITQDTARLTVRSDRSPEFVYHALQSPSVQQQIRHHTIGQAVQGINIGEVRKLQLPWPTDDSEREAIVDILSALGAQTAAERTVGAAAEALKSGLMQELLTGRRRWSGANIAHAGGGD